MAWDATGWTYYKVLTVDQTDDLGAGNPLYQIKLLIGKTSGATGEQVDCAGHCEDDFDDLRFSTDAAPASATLLDYWIESVAASGTSFLATVWVEVPMPDDAADTNIRMYYGNAGASAGSNGANTFIQYKGSASASFREAAASGTSGSIRYRVSGKVAAGSVGYFGITDTSAVGGGNALEVLFYSGQGQRYCTAYKATVDTTTAESGALNDGNYHIVDLYFTYSSLLKGFVDDAGGQIGSNITTGLPTVSMGLWFSLASGTGDQQWSFISRWTANEPTWGSFGAETSTGWANIAKINGVLSADLSKVNNIAVADIAKVCGVAV
jgi:hypothetical protein